MPASFSLETSNHFNSLIGVTVLLSFSLTCLTTRWWSLPTSAPLLKRTSCKDFRHLPLMRRWSIWFLSLWLDEIQVSLCVSFWANRMIMLFIPKKSISQVRHNVSTAFDSSIWHNVSTAWESRLKHNVSMACDNRVQHNVSTSCDRRVWHGVIIACDRRVWHYVSMAFDNWVRHSVSIPWVSRIWHNVSKAYDSRERHNVSM